MARPRILLMLGLAGAVLAVGTVTAPLASAGTGTEVRRVSLFDRLRERFNPPAAADPGGCAAVKIIGARGTGEPQGLGFLLSGVARDIDRAVSAQTVTEDLVYPASGNILGSARQGVDELTRQLADEQAACPSQQLVLMGYSQGAIVVGDTLAAVGPDAAANVAAVIFFGDPRFVSGEPFNVGTFGPRSRGVFPRPAGQLDAFADRIQSFCNGADPVCQAAGGTGQGGGHLAYGQFSDDAATFVAGKV